MYEKKLVNNSTIINWLRKRHLGDQSTVKNEYLMNRNQMLKEQEMTGVFQKFDSDQSGSIELNELYQMFTNYGIDVTKSELKTLFSIVDKDGSGSLSLEEFKRFSSNPMANKVFRNLIQRVRRDQERIYGKDRMKDFLPFNLSRLLDYLSHMSKRESLIGTIETTKFKHEQTQDNINNFIKLFILDGQAQDSVVKEDSAKIVENMIMNRELQRNDSYPEAQVRLYSLDDDMLDELTQSVINYQPSLKKSSIVREDRKKTSITKLDDIHETESLKTDASAEDNDYVPVKDLIYKAQVRSIRSIISKARERGRESARQEVELSKKSLEWDSRSRLNREEKSIRNQKQAAFTNARIRFQSVRTSQKKSIYSTFEHNKENHSLLQNTLLNDDPYQLSKPAVHIIPPQTLLSPKNQVKQLVIGKKITEKFGLRNDKSSEEVVKLPGIMRMKQSTYDRYTDKQKVMTALLSEKQQLSDL